MASKNVLIIGDIVLDEYINGHYKRIASETGVPLLSISTIDYIIGGAGNVAANISSAGITVSLISIIGNDEISKRCIQLLHQYSIDTSMLYTDNNWNVSKKTRYMIDEMQVFRCDLEKENSLTDRMEQLIINNLLLQLKKFDLLIIVDYCQGLITPDLARKIIILAQRYHKKVIADSKDPILSHFRESYLIKTNYRELELVSKVNCNTLENIIYAARSIIKSCDCKYVLTTWSENGMVLTSETSVKYLPNDTKSSVVCVVGAGDTVTAYFSIGIINNLELEQCLSLSSKAAQIAIALPQTSVIPFSDITQYFDTLKEKNNHNL